MTADALWLQLESAEAGHAVALDEALAAIAWNDTGLIPVITQRHDSGEVLTSCTLSTRASWACSGQVQEDCQELPLRYRRV